MCELFPKFNKSAADNFEKNEAKIRKFFIKENIVVKNIVAIAMHL